MFFGGGFFGVTCVKLVGWGGVPVCFETESLVLYVFPISLYC